jgi:hypothetical protein
VQRDALEPQPVREIQSLASRGTLAQRGRPHRLVVAAAGGRRRCRKIIGSTMRFCKPFLEAASYITTRRSTTLPPILLFRDLQLERLREFNRMVSERSSAVL